jgi:hypothetical protein
MLARIRRGLRESVRLIRLRRELELVRAELVRVQLSTESLLVDLALLSEDDRRRLPVVNTDIDLWTEHPLAVSSVDHQFPRGSATDFTRWPAFVGYCERLYGHPMTYLDLGCAGGGVVLDFVLRKSLAIGLEGSDYSLRRSRAAWKVIPSSLFTCDICSPYTLTRRGEQETFKFDVIGAWEVLEHIPESLVPAMLKNVVDHMHSKSVFMGSIATFLDEDRERQIVWHVTVRPRDWWLARFREAGLEPARVPFDPMDMPRGSGNGPFDWSAVANPNLGFHVIMKKVGSPGPCG